MEEEEQAALGLRAVDFLERKAAPLRSSELTRISPPKKLLLDLRSPAVMAGFQKVDK